MAITRRRALQALGAASATALLPKRAFGRSRKTASARSVGVLFDATRCIGCRECVKACAEQNDCDAELATSPGAQLTPLSLTVLNEYDCGGTQTFLKVQCMHCIDPACVSACMLGAMSVDAAGAVTWNGDLCVGCRYCQIGCPYNVPKFEWESPTPKLTKCELCPERRAQGREPACVERCRRGALTFGLRTELLADARQRIAAKPERYNPTIYGETEGGGTAVLYLTESGVSFADLGLPLLGTTSVPSLPETIQHTIYKGFMAPLAFLATAAATVRYNVRRGHGAIADEQHEEARSEPVGGKLFTWPFAVLLTLFLIGVAGIAWRFVAGLGATTNLNDGYPMGLWIAFDVVTGTALACGGYAVALLVYLLNRGRYHPLVRAAIVTSALGYSLGGLSVLIDIGRAWNFYKIPLYVRNWNVNSILLEVALCIMLYTCVLWIELSPALLERWREARAPGLRRFALALTPRIERAMPYVIAVGLLLPTMHQSSLGSLMLLAGGKLHPLWRTPLLPLLFLVSCVGMGYAAVTLEATISAKVFKRPAETPMLRALTVPITFVLLTYAVLRMIDVVMRGELGHVLALDRYAILFLIEMSLFVVPALGLLVARRIGGAALLATLGALVILGGALYRFSTYLIAYDPGPAWSYFPSLPEFAVTIGLVSAELLGYLILVKRFPILRGAPAPPLAVRSAPPPDVCAEAQHHTGAGPTLPVQSPSPAGARGQAHYHTGVASSSVSPTASLATLLVLFTCVSVAAPLQAQVERRGREDLRCLTADPATCLPEPVSVSEPHEAVCATCHNLSQQKKFSEAAKTCASAGCHTNPATLTSFHRGLPRKVLDNCISCHPPHDARIPGGAANCSYCHAAGGTAPLRPQPAAERVVAPGAVFRHSRHDAVACVSCHHSGGSEQHRVTGVARLRECRSCHHADAATAQCVGCHEPASLRAIASNVTRTFDMQLGSLNRPQRTLPFEHATHLGARCQTCHSEGLALGVSQASCASCHAEHHQATATCTTCHALPVAGAHDRNAHLGCAGIGCHDAAPASIRAAPRTRSLCLACHERTEHMNGRNCVDCHRLPKPRGGS